MADIDHVTEINAGQNREHEGLQVGDQEFEGRQRHDGEHRDETDQGAEATEGQAGDDKAGEDLHDDVAAEHIAEQPQRQGDGAHDEGDDFDRHQHHQNIPRHARRYEQLEEAGIDFKNVIDNKDDTATNPNYYSFSEFTKGNKSEDGCYAMVAMMSDNS